MSAEMNALGAQIHDLIGALSAENNSFDDNYDDLVRNRCPWCRGRGRPKMPGYTAADGDTCNLCSGSGRSLVVFNITADELAAEVERVPALPEYTKFSFLGEWQDERRARRQAAKAANFGHHLFNSQTKPRSR